MFKKIFTILFACFSSVVFAQKVRFDPVDWKVNETVKIIFDVSGTPHHGYSGNLYLWAWTSNGAGDAINALYNGSWTSSAPAALMTPEGDNIFSISIQPTTYFGISKEILEVNGINFLLKKLNGDNNTGGFPGKTDNLDGFLPFFENGIAPNSLWSANKPIRIIVDVSSTLLAGTSDPLYLWSWYNVGSGNVDSPANGSWTNSNPQSQMTRIGTSNVYYKDLTPSEYFNTSIPLNSQQVFGLIKKLNGNAIPGKTDDFGKNMPFKHYTIYQINAANVSLSPSLPMDNVPVTITFQAKGALKGTTQSVFIHSGVVTDGLSSTAWNNTQGIWGDSTSSPGKMTKIGLDTYEITFPSIRQYFQMTSGQNAYKIMAVFRTADGGLVEKDGQNDYQLEISPGRYLEIREPIGSFKNVLLNEPFRITGYSNHLAHLKISINGQEIQNFSASNRISSLYQPTQIGNYEIEIISVIGTDTLKKYSNFVVCNQNSIQTPAPLPLNMKYGINYHPSENDKVTLVLHAPTESIRAVHVIGDFNQWQVNCDYLMQWDNTKKVFWKTITGLNPGQEYIFQYLIDGETRIGDPYTHKVSDPWNDASIPSLTYPGLIQYPTEALPKNGETPTIASVLQTQQVNYNWQVTDFARPPQDRLNIYQLHFRDFTMEGTYLAAIEKLDYLKRLGINAIETLPVSEFEGNDSWGYNPNYYFAADKAYGTSNEYKMFVDECHKRGIAVIGDIVLNHAFGTNPHARLYWNKYKNRPANNNPWFNQVSNFSNPGAQWGNDFNHQSPYTQAFVDSVIHFWVKEYKIDGIRFDFTKGFGNTPYPNSSCGDEWGGCYDAGRVALLKRMADYMWNIDNGATGSHPYVIFEHLAHQTEDTEIGNYGNGILLWSGVSPNHKYGEIAMGWPPTLADPNKSNVAEAYYKNKGFSKPIWVSYMESHDEDRLGYFQTQYGNGNVKTDLAVRSKFLQTAAVMNLLMTGPRQIWQFGEFGYDVHINFNGRTGRKPVRWDYFEVPERQKIYETYSKLFWLRNRLPNTFHKDIDNPGGTKTDFTSQFKRYHFYSSVGDTAVTIIANTANSVISGFPDFNASTVSQWFDMNTLQWHTVSNNMTLQPGEFRIFMNKKPVLNTPKITLSDTLSNGNALDTTKIAIQFKESVLKKIQNSTIGQNFNQTNFSPTFVLLDSDSVAIFCNLSQNIDKSVFYLTPSLKLYPGQYKLKINGDSIQNYGGISLDSLIQYSFEVQVSKKPCQSFITFTSPADDNEQNADFFRSNSFINAENKIKLKARIDYTSVNSISLNPGFEASPNFKGVFHAQIKGCDE